MKNRSIQAILQQIRATGKINQIPTFANEVYAIGDNAILKIYDSRKEWRNTLRVYALLKQQKLATPRIISSGASPRPYLFMERLKGAPISKQRTVKTYRRFGAWVGRLHQVTFQKFGGLSAKGIDKHECGKGPFKNWKQLHLALVEQRMKGFERTILAPLIPRIRAYFKAADYPAFKPTLLHEDLNTKNIFVKNDVVIGVIDPDGGYAGCAEEELMRIEVAHFRKNPDLRKAFMEGYTKFTQPLPGYEQRRTVFFLSRTLVEAWCIIHLKTYKKGSKRVALQKTRKDLLRIIER